MHISGISAQLCNTISADDLVRVAIDELSFLDDVHHNHISGTKRLVWSGSPARYDDLSAIRRLAEHCAIGAAQHLQVPEHDHRVCDAIERLVEAGLNKPEPEREKEWPWNPL